MFEEDDDGQSIGNFFVLVDFDDGKDFSVFIVIIGVVINILLLLHHQKK